MSFNCMTYLCNAGVMLQIGDKKIIIDGLCSTEDSIYKYTPKELRERIIKGVPPFNDIDLMLITHDHHDHFDADSVAAFLERNPRAVVVGNRDIVRSVKKRASMEGCKKLLEIERKPHDKGSIHLNGITIEAISMLHSGKEFESVNNLAFLIRCGKTVLHLGDAEPTKANFEQAGLPQGSIDLLLANFPYISLPSARQLIRQYIEPKKIAIVHMPDPTRDRFGWIATARKSYDRVREDFMETHFIEDIGQTIEI